MKLRGMTDEIKSQSPVGDVLHKMRNGPIPPHKRDSELAAFCADQFEQAWRAEKKTAGIFSVADMLAKGEKR